MKPSDAALIASALVLTGRHALAIYDNEQYKWPEDYEKLTKRMVGELDQISASIEPVKKTKTVVEEEPILVNVGLTPNFSAGERLLGERKDLKSKLSEMLESGVEFIYSPTDLGWQWALDRANWATIADSEISRRIKIKASFTVGAVGVEMGTQTKKKPSKKAAASAAVPDEELAAVAEAIMAEPEESAEAETV